MKDWLAHFVGNAGRLGLITLLAAAPTTLLLTHVWYQFRITRLGYEISEETDRHEKLADEHRKLEIEATVESRGDRLTDLAKRRFGLERVEPEQIITVESSLGSGATARRDGSGQESGETSLDETEHAALERERAD